MDVYAPIAGEVQSVDVIQSGGGDDEEGHAFIEFRDRHVAEEALRKASGISLPGSDQPFRIKWASERVAEGSEGDPSVSRSSSWASTSKPTMWSSGRKHGPQQHSVYVGDVPYGITDEELLAPFQERYGSARTAKVVTDQFTGFPKGYGFVRFVNSEEHRRALSEMQGLRFRDHHVRVANATSRRNQKGGQQGIQGRWESYSPELDLRNTTIFVGGVEPGISEEQLRSLFEPYGQLIYVKVPPGKGCGFVQFMDRGCAEQALSSLNGVRLGNTHLRLSWGRSGSASHAPSPNRSGHPHQASVGFVPQYPLPPSPPYMFQQMPVQPPLMVNPSNQPYPYHPAAGFPPQPQWYPAPTPPQGIPPGMVQMPVPGSQFMPPGENAWEPVGPAFGLCSGSHQHALQESGRFPMSPPPAHRSMSFPRNDQPAQIEQKERQQSAQQSSDPEGLEGVSAKPQRAQSGGQQAKVQYIGEFRTDDANAD